METREKLGKQAQELFDSKGRICLEYSTGVGKTKAALDLIDKDGGEWDICTPTVAISKGWLEEIEKFGMQHLKPKLRIYCYQSLHKYISHDRGINFCLDEGHNITEKRRDFILLGIKPHNKVIALSATVDAEKKGLLEEIGIGRDSYLKFNTDKAVKAGIVTDYEMYAYTVPLGGVPEKLPRFTNPISEKQAYAFLSKKVREAQQKQDWKSMQFFAIWRKQLLSGLISKEKVAVYLIGRLPKDKKSLIFAASIEQSDRLCENSYHSKGEQDVLDRFKDDEIMMMSSVAKIREGVNVQADIIIKTGIDSKEKNMVQTLGRALRLNPNEPNKKAIAVILIAEGTQEEVWLGNSTQSFKNLKVRKWKLN